MILQELYKLYDRLVTDEDYKIPRPGYSLQKISFCIVLNEDGTFEFQDERVVAPQGNGKPIPKELIVPGKSAHASGSGIEPFLLWDKPEYLFGHDKKKPKRAKEQFEASKKAHIELAKKFPGEPDVQAVARFFEKWSIERDLPLYGEKIEEFGNGNGVFRLTGNAGYIHENSCVAKTIVADIIANTGVARHGTCLISGNENVPVARLHEPKIKNVANAQSYGANVVSFKPESFKSYGWEQGGNASTSTEAVNHYCEALNALLRSDKHKLRIGETTIVFWTEEKTITEGLLATILGLGDEADAPEDEANDEQVEGFLFGEGTPSASKAKKKKKSSSKPQDPVTLARVKAFWENLRSAKTPETELVYDDGRRDAPGTKFFMLGISPNDTRLSIRFWHAGTLGDFVAKLKAHHDAMRIQKDFPDKEPDFIPLKKILLATVRSKKTKDISPRLGGELIRAILEGLPYPLTLLQQIITRLRHGDNVGYVATATIKAFLTRNKGKEISMSLDKENKQPAYLLGRLFAMLEKAQKEATDAKATIRDRFYAAASATPRTVFPILLRTFPHHLAKLEQGREIFFDKLVQEISSGIDAFPSHMNLEDQGLFAIGYYHQKCALFTKKEESPSTAAQ